ncbi:hypothetical protein Tco_0152508 [Tanacetum coccineum]
MMVMISFIQSSQLMMMKQPHDDGTAEDDSFDHNSSYTLSYDKEMEGTKDTQMPILKEEMRLKALEENFSELRQTNQYAEALSSIPGIVDHYLANKMQEVVDVAVQTGTANLSELELKKILIDKMESNNSINRSDIQRQLYQALVNAYEADKILLDTYGDMVTIKRPRDGADDDQEPSAGTDRGSKRRRSGKEPESTSAPRETTTIDSQKDYYKAL